MSLRYHPRQTLTPRLSMRPHRRRSFSDRGNAATAREEPTTAPRGQSYLPALDGIRALAVLVVVIYHARPDWLPGGFLGVDVFFAISGFIITRALVTEWRETRGINIRRFYLRRAQRLGPALVLVIAAVLTYALVFQPAQVARLRGDTIAAMLQVTNWHFVLANQSYFEAFARPSALRHLWSLAVEEQFYLLWPLLLAAGLRVLKPKAMFLFVALLALSSMALMTWLHAEGVSAARLYYGSDTRAAGLLIGAAVALSAASHSLPMDGRRLLRLPSVGLDVLGLAALGLIGVAVVMLNESHDLLYGGGFSLVALASAILILASINRAGVLTRVLSIGPLRWVGQRSYGIYLWHWPIALLTWPELPTTLQVVAGIAAATAIAALSYRLVERPVRDGRLTSLLRRMRPGGGFNLLQRGSVAMTAAVGLAGLLLLGVAVANTRSPEVPPYLAAGSVRLINQASPAPSALLEPDNSSPAIEPPAAPVEEQAALVETPAPPSEAHVPAAASVSAPVFSAEAPKPAATRAPMPAPLTLPAGSPMVTIIGDSVLLGAANELAYRIPLVDIDAQVGRQADAAVWLLYQRLLDGSLGNVIVMNIGNNGTLTDAQFDQIMTIAGPSRRVVFVNNKVPRRWEDTNNAVIQAGVAYYPNAVLVDWNTESSQHPDFFWDDAVHLRPEGAATFANMVVAAIRR